MVKVKMTESQKLYTIVYYDPAEKVEKTIEHTTKKNLRQKAISTIIPEGTVLVCYTCEKIKVVYSMPIDDFKNAPTVSVDYVREVSGNV